MSEGDTVTHRYGQAIALTLVGDQPARFRWRGRDVAVEEVLATWHLRDRWWVESMERSEGAHGSAAETMVPGASDRHYYRVRCAGDLFCELYHDAATDIWVLDRVYD